MASLGRLTIDMVANIGGFERDMGKADRVTRQTMRKISRDLNRAERDAEKATRTIRNLGLQVAAISAVGLGLVAREFRNIAQQADRLDKTSRVVAMTAESLQELRFAAEQAAGVTGQTLDMAMQRFARRVGEAANGAGELLPIVKELGIELRNADGSIKSQTQLLGEFADAIANTSSEQEQLRIAFKLFDSEGARLVSLLRQGSDGIEEFREQFRATGATISSEVVADLVRFNDELNVLRQQARALGVSIVSELARPLADFVTFLNTEEGTAAMREALDGIRNAALLVGGVLATRFTAQLVAASAQLVVASVQVARLTAAKLGLAGASRTSAAALVTFRTAVSTLLGPVGLALGVIAAIAPSLVNLRREFRETAQETESLDERFKSLTQSAQEFRTEQLQSFLVEIEGQMEEAGKSVEVAAIKLAEARDKFNETGDMRAGSEIFTLSEELDEARAAYQDLEDKAETVSQQIVETNRPVENSFEAVNRETSSLADTISGLLTKAAEAATEAWADLNREADGFMEMIEDIETRLAGPMAVAFRQYNDDLAEANRLHQLNALSADEFAKAQQVLGQRLQSEVLPVMQRYMDELLKVATFDFGGEAASDFGRNMGADLARSLSFALSANDGRSLGESVGNAIRSFGSAGIQEGLQDAIAEAMGTVPDDPKFQVAALALGEAIGGNVGAAIGTVLGAAIGSVIPGIGTSVGATIGNLIGSIFGGEKDPIVQTAGRSGFTRNPEEARRRGNITETALGEIFFRFRNVGDQAQDELKRTLQQFDATIAGIIGEDFIAAATAALEGFQTTSQDVGTILQERFNVILRSLDSFTRGVVSVGGTLEEQVQRLADINAIRDISGRTGSLGFDSADSLLAVIAELNTVGESLGDTFGRARDVLTELLPADQLLEETVQAAQQRAADLLSSIGVDASGLGGNELQELFRSLFGTLSPEDTAVLIEAGESIVDLIEAEEGLARLRGDVAEEIEDQSEALREREQLERRLLDAQGDILALRELELAGVDESNRALLERILALDAEAERLGVLQGINEVIALSPLNDFQQELVSISRGLLQNIRALNQAAQAAGNQAAAESDLARAHEAASIQVAASVDRLMSSTARLVDEFFGTPLDDINQQISELQASSQGAVGAISNVNTALAGLIQFADSLLVGNLSPLGSRRRLQEGLDQLRAASAAGDAARVQQLSQQVLGIGRERFASGNQFSQLFDEVQAIIRGTRPAQQQTQPVSIETAPGLADLFEERDRLEAEQREQELRTIGLDLSQNIADLAGVTGDAFAEVADSLGFDLFDLAERLGFDPLEFESFLTGLQVDTDSIAQSLENVGQDLDASIRDFADRSIPVQEATRDNTAEIAAAVNRLIEATRERGTSEGRSLRTRVRA